MPVIMGRKTFESLGKALVGRTNIVITRQKDFKADDATVVATIEEAMAAAADVDAKEAFIIGGGEIYRQTLPLVTTVYLTRVHTVIEGDTFFPELPPSEWELASQLDFVKDEKHAFDYCFQVWKRSVEV